MDEATREVEVAITRVALLHLSFASTLVKDLGEERGRELILKSIMEYGRRIGERTKRGAQSLPKFGVYRGSRDGKIYDCIFSKVFHEYGEEDLGCLYCYVDAAQSMGADPKNKLVHKECAACGDDFCTFELVKTTDKEKKDFASMNVDWRLVDPRLAQGVKKKR